MTMFYRYMNTFTNFFVAFIINNLAAGERLSIAVDLAAQDALLKLWNVSNSTRVFPFKNVDIYQKSFKNQTFNVQNHSLRKICQERLVHFNFFVSGILFCKG